MLEKGYLQTIEHNGIKEDSKIDFFKKIKTDKLDSISVIFDDTSPDIVKQAALFINKANKKGLQTAVKGLYVIEEKSVIAKEYVKNGDDWIFYFELTTKHNQGLEYTTIGKSNFKVAISRIDGINYVAFEGTNKVFIIQNEFTASFGYINMVELNEFVSGLPDKEDYLLDNINQEVYLVDAPAQLFAHDTAFYRDGDFIGVWISFGTFIKYDLQNLNNINIDGVPVSLVDINLDTKHKLKKMLENKAAGYASLVVNTEALLSYLLKNSKEYILNKTKMSGNRVCTDSVLENLEDKGILGIVYEEVFSYKEIYMPVFDYTTASVKEVVDSAIVFIYQDEYIWMNYSKEDKEINFLSYKGQKFEFGDKNITATVMPDILLSRVSKVNDENFVLFTGFSNLENNSVLDFYFDDTTTITTANNSKFAIDVTSFDSFYNDKVSNFNNVFNKENELIKTFGANKYVFETGLAHYELKAPTNKIKYYKLETKTDISYRSVIDAVNKKAYICKPVFCNYGYSSAIGSLEYASWKPNFGLLAAEILAPELLPKRDGKVIKTSPTAFWFTIVNDTYSNGWITFKDKENEKYLTLHTERDIYKDILTGNYMSKALSVVNAYKQMAESGTIKIDAKKINEIAAEIYNEFAIFMSEIAGFKYEQMVNTLSKTVRLTDEKYRYEFDKKSDNIYVNNTPTSEICNHAILFEDAFRKAAQNKIEFKNRVGVSSPYFLASHTMADETGVSISVQTDNSKSSYGIEFPKMGIIAKQSFEMPDDDVMTYAYDMVVKNNGTREIDGVLAHIYSISYGATYTINLAAIDKICKPSNILKQKVNVEDDITKTEQEREYIEEELSKYVNLQDKASYEHSKITSTQNRMEFGVPSLIAYMQGKILVSVDGSSWYEPFYTDNGLRLTSEMYVADIDAFELQLQNLSITDYSFIKVDGNFLDRDFVDLNQIRLHKIKLDNTMTNAYIEFEFKDVACVYQDILYQPGEIIKTVISIDVDYDKIVSKEEGTFRNVYVEPVISYKTIYPIDTKNEISNAEDILNNENCFTVEHSIPLAITLDSLGYMYETKTDALNDGAQMFFKFN